MNGYITKGIGGFYYVKVGDEIIECKAKGIFRKRNISPVAGDEVRIETENGGNVIAEIYPRKNIFIRPPIANLDVLFIVSSTIQPVPSTLVIDKLTAIAVDKNVTPVLIFTKGDLSSTEFLKKSYELAAIKTIEVDYKTGLGLDEVKSIISGKLTAFCGNSGVGKSTLLNELCPEIAQKTAEISQKLKRGKHTTREVTVFEAFGGRIADTPGFATMDTEKACYISKDNLALAFPDFAPYRENCRFTGCAHRKESGCEVTKALAEGKISVTRYASYATMYDEVKDVKEWDLPRK